MWDAADVEADVPAGTSFVTFVQASSASPAAADAVREFLAERIWSKAAAHDIPTEHRSATSRWWRPSSWAWASPATCCASRPWWTPRPDDLASWVGPTLDRYIDGQPGGGAD